MELDHFTAFAKHNSRIDHTRAVACLLGLPVGSLLGVRVGSLLTVQVA